MRVTVTKHETPQGIVLRARKGEGRRRSERSLLRLTVFVSFLNQRYDEYHFGVWADWDRDTSLLGFLYGPYVDGLLEKQTCEFYAETRAVQKEIIRTLDPIINNRRQGADEDESLIATINANLQVYLQPYLETEKEKAEVLFPPLESGFGLWRAARSSFAVEPPTFRAYVYGLLGNIYEDGHLPKLARCLWCTKFFVRPNNKEKHCSPRCQKLRDQQESGRRHLNRLKEETPTKQPRPSETNTGRKLFEKVKQLYLKSSLTGNDKDFLVRVSGRVSQRSLDIKRRQWDELSMETRQEYDRAALTLPIGP